MHYDYDPQNIFLIGDTYMRKYTLQRPMKITYSREKKCDDNFFTSFVQTESPLKQRAPFKNDISGSDKNYTNVSNKIMERVNVNYYISPKKKY